MLVFGLFAFIIMIMVAGIAVDMMRYESERVRLQGATDRAVLAGTALRANNSGADPKQIVRSYLSAAGYAHMIDDNSVTIVENAETGRTVTAAPAGSLSTFFMRLAGVDDLSLRLNASANEAVGGNAIEIVVVLDVSGSMNHYNRIDHLRNALEGFVEDVLAESDSVNVALTIVPYDGIVLPTSGFANFFTNVTTGSGACFDFDNFSDVAGSGFATPIERFGCAQPEVLPSRMVAPYVTSVAQAMHAVSGTPQFGSGTSIDLGVRFGALYFDPAIRPAISQMIDNGTVDPKFVGFPRDWDAGSSSRYMIVMSDGQNSWSSLFDRPTESGFDAKMAQACDAIKAQGIIIYGVAFEAPQGGIDALTQCASSPNHFSYSEGPDLSDSFSGIAGHIQTQTLRLVQ